MLLAANTSQHQEETTEEQRTQHHLVFLVRSGLTLRLWTIPSQLYCRNPTGIPFGQVRCLTNTGPQLTLMAASYIHASLQKKNFVHDLQKQKLKISTLPRPWWETQNMVVCWTVCNFNPLWIQNLLYVGREVHCELLFTSSYKCSGQEFASL